MVAPADAGAVGWVARISAGDDRLQVVGLEHPSVCRVAALAVDDRLASVARLAQHRGPERRGDASAAAAGRLAGSARSDRPVVGAVGAVAR